MAVADPHVVARTPSAYRRYIADATAEFTAIKGVDVSWQDGLGERSRGGVSRARPAGRDGRHGRGEVFAGEERFSFCA